ncbi:hypothetical protein [uncultured Thiodictyon sp.]|uniref:hypothetical protein n=1 Tax=uncultured Thiodictyon sp. TaxID=1846217 RepID=UPI0025FB6452|nr:hypothetical protein [uncultured Thiodictyon sp.]
MTDTPLRTALINIGNIIAEFPNFRLVWQTADGVFDCHIRYKGERLGRDFYIYDHLVEDFSTTFALTDFAGILLGVLEREPALFEEKLRAPTFALGQLCAFADERADWGRVWK